MPIHLDGVALRGTKPIWKLLEKLLVKGLTCKPYRIVSWNGNRSNPLAALINLKHKGTVS